MKSRIQLLIIAVSLAIITIVLGSAQVLGYARTRRGGSLPRLSFRAC